MNGSDKKRGISSWAIGLFSLLVSICYPDDFPEATPFPVVGNIYDGKGQEAGKAHVYPQYVEIMNRSGQLVGKIGILTEDGIRKLFIVRQDNTRTLVGYAVPTEVPNKGRILDHEDNVKGTYIWTPTWSFIYQPEGKRVGKVKCIAWPRVCAAGVGSYLLGFFNPGK